MLPSLIKSFTVFCISTAWVLEAVQKYENYACVCERENVLGYCIIALSTWKKKKNSERDLCPPQKVPAQTNCRVCSSVGISG